MLFKIIEYHVFRILAKDTTSAHPDEQTTRETAPELATIWAA
jgi:hypothetical protein